MSEAIKQPVGPEGIIQMQGVNKWYGQFHVLKDINLNVRQGERIVLCGPSGSGKSTTIRCLNRLEEHQQGRIVVDGVELTTFGFAGRRRFSISATAQMRPRQSTIAMTPTGSCHSSIAPLPASRAKTTVRTRFTKNATPSAAANSPIRRPRPSRWNSPRKSDAMKAVCSERMPLHASSTFTQWSATCTRLPCASAGMPIQVSTSALTVAFRRINPWLSDSSSHTGHGSAVKQNRNGNAKCRA